MWESLFVFSENSFTTQIYDLILLITYNLTYNFIPIWFTTYSLLKLAVNVWLFLHAGMFELFPILHTHTRLLNQAIIYAFLFFSYFFSTHTHYWNTLSISLHLSLSLSLFMQFFLNCFTRKMKREFDAILKQTM